MTIIVDHPDDFPAACHAEIARLAEERRTGMLRLMSEVDAARARADSLAGALRYLIACWETEAPGYVLHAAFDNAKTVLEEAR